MKKKNEQTNKTSVKQNLEMTQWSVVKSAIINVFLIYKKLEERLNI